MAPLDPISPAQWNAAAARHLLNRAGFGIPRERIDALAAMSAEQAVDRFLDIPAAPAVRPEWVLDAWTPADRRLARRGLDREARQERYRRHRRAERDALQRLKGWWLERMYTTPHPLQEKLALFWHGHFATSSQKVVSSQAAFDLGNVFRTHGLGNAKRLTIAVGQSVSMIRYLDQQRSSRRSPNENWARELMELFTLGPGRYTEADIKASARAFTGWRSNNQRFVYDIDDHDDGDKSFLGRTGPFDGWRIIDIIFEQPACAEFLAHKLWTHFAYDDPEPEVVQALAATLRAHDYDLAPTLRVLFLSQAFHGERARLTQVKSPTQHLLMLAHDLGLDAPPYQVLARGAAALGQDLFYPPNVNGWEGGRAWINANTLLQRYNLPQHVYFIALRGEERERLAMQPMMQRSMSGNMQPTEQEDARASMQRDARPRRRAAIRRAQAARRDAFQEALQERIQALPPEERQAAREVLQDGDAYERNALLHEWDLHEMLDSPLPPLDLEGLRFNTAGEAIDAITQRYLGRTLAPEQRTTLLEALGAADAAMPLTPATFPEIQRRALMRLLTSTAEYQLC